MGCRATLTINQNLSRVGGRERERESREEYDVVKESFLAKI